MTHDTADDKAIVAYLDAIPHPETTYRSRLRASLAAQPESRRFSWRWPALGAAVTRERDGIGGRDRAAQAAAIVSWGAERDALPVPPAVDSL